MSLIRIDMTDQRVTSTELPERYRRLGGRGLTAQLLADEVNPRCYALGRDNKLIFAPGLLTGTSAPCSGRTSLGAKSPLTGTIKESNVGGIAGQYLAGQGIRALVIEGAPRAAHQWLLILGDGQPRLEIRDELAGRGNYATVESLRAEFGADCAVLSVGPTGERRGALATVAVCDAEGRPTRHAGRGGMGAVMASKGLKAIVVRRPARRGPLPVDAARFSRTVKDFAKGLVAGKKALTSYGTAVLVNMVNEAGGLPTRNFSTGHNDQSDRFSGEKLRQLARERGGRTGHNCHPGCVIRCSNVFHGADGSYLTAGLEYETIALFGPNCGVHDLDQIARFDRLCDDLGIDTMEMGVALGVAMEGGVLEFGDADAMAAAIRATAGTEPLGKILRQGATVTGRIFGVERVPAVKGQSLSGYDPRAMKGTGVTYATSTMGADHTAGNCLPGRGGLMGHEATGQTQLSRATQEMSMACDLLGVCVFVGPVAETMPALAELLSAFWGEEVTCAQLLEQGRQVLRVEAEFNRQAGINSRQNDLPAFFRSEPLPNNGQTFDVPVEELNALDFAVVSGADATS
jgi:aldehyde:ferredoxin oxidoreductase